MAWSHLQGYDHLISPHMIYDAAKYLLGFDVLLIIHLVLLSRGVDLLDWWSEDLKEAVGGHVLNYLIEPKTVVQISAVFIAGGLALISVIGGVLAVFFVENSKIQVEMFGTTFQSKSVGAGLVFMGLVIFFLTIRTVLNSFPKRGKAKQKPVKKD